MRTVYWGMVVVGMLAVTTVCADIGQDLRDHEGLGLHVGALSKADAAMGVAAIFVVITGLVGVIYKTSARQLDKHGEKIDGMTMELVKLNGTVARHESELRRGDDKFGKVLESMEGVRRVCFAQLDDLNERRVDKGLPPVVLD